MDLSLFSSVIQNLLHTNVTRPHTAPGAYRDFEEKYCYSPLLQPVFTAETLAHLMDTMDDQVVYDVRGPLGVCILFFRFGGEPFLIGPFVREAINMKKVQSALIASRMSASTASSVKLYYSAFPMVSEVHARDTVLSVIRAFSDGEEYAICRLQNAGETSILPQRSDEEAVDYGAIYRSYERENRFLARIEAGDTENVLIAFGEMVMNTSIPSRYVSAVYQDPAIGLSMLRALARKAAERGGASPVEINEITQRAIQRMSSLRGSENLTACTREMVLELTEAVRRARLSMDLYSAPILRAIEYISFHFSQEISSAYLASLAGLSETYFTKMFKKETGTTVSKYIARLRCDEAARMLRESDVAVQNISHYVGYSDNNYFVKVFRAQYGVTPSDYRAGNG